MVKVTKYETAGGLLVHPTLRAFVDGEVLPGAGVEPTAFWSGLASIIADLAPRHRELLAVRDDLQARIDAWHRERKGQQHDSGAYEQFLRDIGYLVPAPAADAYQVATKNVDAEIGTVAGPQLVAPLSNARYALEAANARWASLYDALYDTDAISEANGAEKGAFNPARAQSVIARVRSFLDQIVPLAQGSHADATGYLSERGKLQVTLSDGSKTGLLSAAQFSGFAGPRHEPASILLSNNGLYIELVIDREHAVGRLDAAGIADVVIEAAISVIMDLEDTVAAVDAEDKVAVYRNWLQLMDGSLSTEIAQGDETVTLKLVGDRAFTAPGGGMLTLAGRPTMLVRNVGHHLFTNAVLDEAGNPAPAAIIDAAVTVACAVQDIRGEKAMRNSRTGSVYVVKPKMHGPDEVGLSDLLFKRIEELLGLPKYTMKIGVIDEERRTSANLAACLSRVRDRTFFINTDFFDRTGDEIHTSMEAGPMLPKGEMENASWFKGYEANNVDVGIARNLPGRAQIGKGMWTAPDLMAALIEKKIAHPRAGASTAWVTTPTAAVLHAMHYHVVDIAAVQDNLRDKQQASLDDLLTIPLATHSYSADDVKAELENNLQRLLGYVVRWIDHGVGLSTASDLDGVRVMEDRAMLRFSSQHVANWLHHGIVSANQVRETMRRMAAVVDTQNAETEDYRPLAPDFNGPAFNAAEDLVFKGRTQPNGYVEAILGAYRLEAKELYSGGVSGQHG